MGAVHITDMVEKVNGGKREPHLNCSLCALIVASFAPIRFSRL